MRETDFGVELLEGDHCFVVYKDGPPRKGRIVGISDCLAMVRMDDSDDIELCSADRLTLSFALLHENQRRREKDDIVARLEEACNGHPHAKIEWPHRLLHDAIAEIKRLRAVLEESVKLQSHYAQLLNMHDGGERRTFSTTKEWTDAVGQGR